MSAKILTAEQRAAVEAEGETLVSASAGSGKTFVMIEKIISLILEGKAQISGVLAVTFTNLAAAEMKEKLKRAIVGRINEETDEGVKSRLKYELSEIGRVGYLHAALVLRKPDPPLLLRHRRKRRFSDRRRRGRFGNEKPRGGDRDGTRFWNKRAKNSNCYCGCTRAARV